jgi:hypothetical protein
MKQIAFLILIFNSTLSFADSTNTAQKIFEKKLISLETLHKSYADSINRELNFYRLKEDYFTVALEDQSNRFTLIVSTFAGLVALVSFAGFRSEIIKLKKEYETQVNLVKNELTAYKKKNKEYDKSMQVASGNIFALAADGFSSKGEYILALEFYLASARAHSLSGQMLVEDNESTEGKNPFFYATGNLKSAIDSLGKIIEVPKNKHILQEKSTKLLEELTTISQSKDPDLLDLCAEFRVTINNFI